MAQINLGGSVGVPGSVFVLGNESVAYASDADVTLSPAQYSNYFLELTSSVSLTATRKLVAPLNPGQTFLVSNQTTGGQSIEVIGPSGTGISVLAGSQLLVGTDGVNYSYLGGAPGGFGLYIFRPGGVTAGNMLTTAAQVATTLSVVGGAAIIVVDTSLAPAVIPAGVTWDMKNVGAIVGGNGNLYDTTLTIADTGQIKNPNALQGMTFNSQAQTGPSFDFDDWANPEVNYNEVIITTDAIATIAPWLVPAGGTLTLQALNGLMFTNNGASLPLVALASGGAGAGGVLTFVQSFGYPIPAEFVSGDASTTFAIAADASTYPLPTFTGFTGTFSNFYVDNAPGVGYTPATPADWVTPPTNVQDALDDLASGSGGVWTQSGELIFATDTNASVAAAQSTATAGQAAVAFAASSATGENSFAAANGSATGLQSSCLSSGSSTALASFAGAGGAAHGNYSAAFAQGEASFLYDAAFGLGSLASSASAGGAFAIGTGQATNDWAFACAAGQASGPYSVAGSTGTAAGTNDTAFASGAASGGSAIGSFACTGAETGQ